MNMPSADNLIVKIIFWCIPVIFGAGAMYSTSNRAMAEAQKVYADAKRIESKIGEHMREPIGHAGTAEKLSQIEKNQAEILKDQKINGQNLAAICQAIGADCK